MEALTVVIGEVALINEPRPRCAHEVLANGVFLIGAVAVGELVGISRHHQIVLVEGTTVRRTDSLEPC